MEHDVKQAILECGAEVCGIAGMERFADAPAGFSPQDVWEECRSVVVFGKALPRGLTRVEPRLIYGHYNSVICAQVDRVALDGAKVLEKRFGALAVPLPCDSPYEYWEKDSLSGRGCSP